MLIQYLVDNSAPLLLFLNSLRHIVPTSRWPFRSESALHFADGLRRPVAGLSAVKRFCDSLAWSERWRNSNGHRRVVDAMDRSVSASLQGLKAVNCPRKSTPFIVASSDRRRNETSRARRMFDQTSNISFIAHHRHAPALLKHAKPKIQRVYTRKYACHMQSSKGIKKRSKPHQQPLSFQASHARKHQILSPCRISSPSSRTADPVAASNASCSPHTRSAPPCCPPSRTHAARRCACR